MGHERPEADRLPLCARTKSQLRRTAAKYRELYDEDFREAVQSETSGNYGKLVS